MATNDGGSMILLCGCECTVTAPARMVQACEQHGRTSLRDHFAGQALALGAEFFENVDMRSDHGGAMHIAMIAYDIADAMLKARDVTDHE